MEKNLFRLSEVISYIEDVILMGAEDEHHEEVYNTYHTQGKVNKNTYAYKKVAKEMSQLWNEVF